MKRYTLTEEGKKFLEEQRRALMHFRMSRKHLASPLLGLLWPRIPLEKVEEVRGAFRHFFKAFFDLAIVLEERFSEEALEETLNILREATQKLENLEKKLRGEGQ